MKKNSKKITKKQEDNKVLRFLYNFYENWIIPQQNETLLELKRREFKEKTKYLDPKILYGLSTEEKTDLRDSGYFVDLDAVSIAKIKNFKLTLDRHENKYRLVEPNYNMGLYNTRYYYVDQNFYLFKGDPDYKNKLWRVRSRPKFRIMITLGLVLFLNINYYFSLKKHTKNRNIAIGKNENKA